MKDVVHIPVMRTEVLSLLIGQNNSSGLVIDATLGAGGHSEALLEKYPDIRIVGIDADEGMLGLAKKRLKKYGNRIDFVHGWFDDVLTELSTQCSVSAILMDLGVSVFHYQSSGRGFSMFKDEPLDMRLFPGHGITAEEILMTKTEEELVSIFSDFGEVRFAKTIAKSIIKHRRNNNIRTAKELADIVFNSVPSRFRHGRIHPATQVFQSLRIAVNNELSRLDRALSLSMSLLHDYGRCAVISFHSLEDRIVKRFFKQNSNKDNDMYFNIITKKPLVPTEDEIKNNPPSRSAKLRVAELVLCKDGVKHENV
ncbi:16S rRNA (cytosine(1402)-N(4))-methyltransferase RsmH [Spirochaetia bacterium 38H-sp]|uniref:Ribosomal RNA small subunit methyltransferase H n=1 Tax=Rarispira pelagica TaxID=3141764 RepID=A0ABU9UDD4_9SPIR